MSGGFLLEQGIEMELKAHINEVIELLDQELPNFHCDDGSYQVSSIKGVLGSQWKLLVRTQDNSNTSKATQPVGHLTINRSADGLTVLKIPPREQWGEEIPQREGVQGRLFSSDAEERFFSSFIFQLLNLFQARGFIDLPQKLPPV